jgi:hypothetical protein
MPFELSALVMGSSTIAAQTATLSLVGTGAAAYSSYQQGEYAEGMGKYNAKVYAAQAESLEKAGEHETREERIEKRRLLAKQLVSFGGGGVVPSAGTPQKIMTRTGAEMERDIGMTQYGYDIAGSQARSKGKIARSYGKSQKRASLWQSGSTVMTGAARAIDYRYNI